MTTEPSFKPGDTVIATGSYNYKLVEGREYIVVSYDEPLVTPTFTFPAYVTVQTENGRVTGHTHRFRPKGT